jgi:hypothetical protein
VIARILALVAAIGMVFGAFVFRYGMPGGGGGDGGDDGAIGNAGAFAIVCASELGAVCDAVPGAVIEPAAVTADRLIAARGAGDARIAGWLAPGPWPAMVDAQRRLGSKAVLFASKGTGLASAPIVAVARKSQLPPGCVPDVTWRCLGDAAQQSTFRIGGDPVSTSSGLFLRAAALNGFFGNADWATNDLAEQPEAQTWLDNLNTRLGAAAGFGARSLDTFVLQQGSANVYLTIGAGAGQLAGNVSFDVRTPTPPVSVSVGYTAAAREGRQIDTGSVSTALRSTGWKVQPNAKTEGLPSPGVLLALRKSS